jgi:hypothetical protein
MRMGYLSSNTKLASSLTMALERAVGTDGIARWSQGLAGRVMSANRRHSKLSGQVPHDDPIWDWIDSGVNDSYMEQSVPLRKSFFSLAWPVHPHVIKHLRYMKNYFNSTLGPEKATRNLSNSHSNHINHAITHAHNHASSPTHMPPSVDHSQLPRPCALSCVARRPSQVADMAELLLAMANKYRYLPSITNGTSTGSNINDSPFSRSGLEQRCAAIKIYDPRWSSPTDEDGNLHIPTRHGNPSPLAALQWAIDKGMGFQDKGEWSITDTPWPMMMKYGIANFPTEECDWIWDNFEYGPFHSPSYDLEYEHIQKVCKPSNWDYSSLPRIAEDGRVCGGLAYWATGIHTCSGRTHAQFDPQPAACSTSTSLLLALLP